MLEISKDLTVKYADRDKWKLAGDNFADFHSFILRRGVYSDVCTL